MAGIQANGVGSGLDINSLVSQLVAAEGAARTGRITRHETAVTTKVSALGSFKGALAAFKTALEPLRNADVFQARKATSADSARFTATATADAAAGSYDVEVIRLATAHQLASQPYVGGSGTAIGYGTLSISVGSESFDVEIAQDANTLEDIRDAINAAPGNTSVQATLLTGTEGTRLVLTSAKTGADHAIAVGSNGGDGGLALLNLTQSQAAANARIEVSGFPVESDTNVIDDAIEGVKINLLKAEEGATFALNVAFDQASVTGRIQAFIAEYNNMRAQLTRLGSYNAATQTAGPLLGDSLLRGVEAELRRGISDPVSGVTGDYTALASIGIKTTVSGTLELDTTKLNDALADDPNAVAQLFGRENGVAARMFERVEARLATGSDLDTRNARLKTELDEIARDKEALELRMAQIEARYRKQFTALDTLLSQMQNTSSYLAQQLATLPKIGS